MIERAVVALVCLVVVGLLVFLFVRAQGADQKRPPKALHPEVIAVCGSVVVSYRPNPERFETFLFAGGESGVAARLREILGANPHADLAPLQDALGILVTNVQRKARREDQVDGIVIGDE